MLATSRLSVEIFNLSRFNSECVLGLEYSGVDKKGLRVMGMSAFGSMATQIESVEHLTWIVPNTLTLRQAATIPGKYRFLRISLMEFHRSNQTICNI